MNRAKRELNLIISERARNRSACYTYAIHTLHLTGLTNSAHFHHESILTEGGVTHIQAPALDGGSLWVQNTLGLTSEPGITTFTVDKQGFHNYQILKT